MTTPATSQPAFNLLDERWIPVRTLQGQVEDVSLSTVLLNASRYSALAETAPPNLVALYRLLLAVLHRALTTHHGPWRDSDRARWFRQGLPEQAVRDYLTQWHEAFWLFHPERPFMQVAALAQATETKDKTKPWTQISLESACGNTPVMFDHAMDDRPQPIPHAVACRNLLGFLQFTPGGLVKTFRDSDKAGPLSNTAVALPLGANLSQSLVLALHPWDQLRQDDLPAWEQPAPTVAMLRAEPSLATGANDRYARRSRAVLLLAAPDGDHIQHIRFGAGLGLEEDTTARDSMASYRINKEGKVIRLSFSGGRAIWRELPTLLPDASGKHSHPAAVLGWASNLYDLAGMDAHVQILVAGLASDQAKLLRWRAESINLPIALLTDPPAAQQLRQRIQQTEDLFGKLRGIADTMVAHTMPDAEHKDTRSRAKAIVTNGPLAATYYACAERGLPLLMQHLAQADDQAADTHWRYTLVQAVQLAWKALAQSLGQTPAVLRAQARADAKYRHLLRPLLTTTPVEETP